LNQTITSWKNELVSDESESQLLNQEKKFTDEIESGMLKKVKLKFKNFEENQ